MAKLILGLVRFSYANVFEPKAINEGDVPKYGVAILIPKTNKALVKKLQDTIKLVMEEAKGSKFGGKVPPNWKNPLRDGDIDRPDDESYAGHYFINANSTTKPGIVDADLNPIMDRDDFYSGCFGRASVNFYAFNVSGSKGIAAGLNNLQKLKDGERLSGGSTAVEDFEDLDDLDDDMLD